jgi:hypothetical protein
MAGRLAWSNGKAEELGTLAKRRYEMNYPGEELSENVCEILVDVFRERFAERQ